MLCPGTFACYNRTPEASTIIRHLPSTAVLFVALVSARDAMAEEIARPQTPAPPLAIRVPQGSLIMCGGGSIPDNIFAHFVELAGGRDGRLVVIPTAGGESDVDEESANLRRWTDRGLARATVLHTRDRAQADTAEFIAPLTDATAVWFRGGQQSRLADSYAGTATEQAIVDLFHRGGVVGGTSAGAAIQSRVMIESGNSTPKIATGLDLLPTSIVDQHFTQRDRLPRLQHAVSQHPECIGVGIDESTALLFRRGECQVLGEACVTVVTATATAGTAATSPAVRTFRAGESFRLHEE